MNKHLKNIIEKVIDMKYREINFKDMSDEEKKEYDGQQNKVNELQDKLKGMLTKEQWKVLNELMDQEISISTIEQSYMFSHGVKIGLNELSFIKEELGLGVIEL